ncbi:hypothetical protein ACU82A_01225 [Bacillus cereus]
MKIKFEMWGLKRNRIADVVEGRIVPLRMFSDMSYVTPKEIADQIKNKAKTENWYFVELDDKEIKQQIARTNHGYSYSNFVELEATQGHKCSQCGSKDELLEVHHLRKVNRNKRINSDAIKQASMNLPKVLLCKKVSLENKSYYKFVDKIGRDLSRAVCFESCSYGSNGS